MKFLDIPFAVGTSSEILESMVQDGILEHIKDGYDLSQKFRDSGHKEIKEYGDQAESYRELMMKILIDDFNITVPLKVFNYSTTLLAMMELKSKKNE